MRSGAAGIGGAAFVVSAVLTATPLYVSSVQSAALQRQFEERCPSRIGLVLPESETARADSVLRATDDSLEGAAGLEPAVRTTFSPFPIPVSGLATGTADQVRVLHRPGAFDDVELLEGPTGDGALVPDSWAAIAGIERGSTVHLAVPAPVDFDDIEPGQGGDEVIIDVPVPVAGIYRDLAGLLPPAPWCLQSRILAPTPNGDPPPPLLLLDEATLADLPVALQQQLSASDVIGVRPEGLTSVVADDLVARFDVAAEAAVAARIGSFGSGPITGVGRVVATSELPAVRTRASGIRDLVVANVRPVQAAGLVAGLTLALAAGLLAARRRQVELVTRSVRGEGPARLAARLAGSAMAPAIAGVVAGGVAAHLAVRAGGPSADLGPVAGRTVRWAAAAGAVTVVAVTAAAASVVARLVDSPVAHLRHRAVRLVPWELAVLPLVVVAARRLDDVGGAQFLGNETTRVDALAMAFPMLAAVGAAVLLVRPMVLLARRGRRVGVGADPAVMLAFRRLGHDPISAAAVAAAVALAAATAVLGGALADSARTALDVKAATFVGSDAAASIAGSDRTLPDSLDGRATVVLEARGSSGNRRVVVAGIDPATFADGARISGAERELVDRLASAGGASGGGGVDGRVAAIVVGNLPEPSVEVSGGMVLDVDAIARPSTFPTSRASSTLVVVDRSVVERGRTSAIVLAAMPAAELEATLTAAGRRVTGVVSVDEVIAGSSIAAVDWAYAGLRALGVVVVAVLLGVQLARSAARVRQRQLGEVFTHAMGLSGRRAAVAEAIEHGIPVVVGLVVGVTVAMAVASRAIADLDSARALPPVSSLVVPWRILAVVAVVAAGALVAVVVGGRHQARRARAAVVLRGA